MTVYKAFGPGMVCKEYHYKPGQVNAEAIANCTRNGIHAAEDVCLIILGMGKMSFGDVKP